MSERGEQGHTEGPPALPEGATWCGQDSDGDWCAVSDDGRRVWIMGDDLTDGWQEFRDAEMFAHVRLVWAMAERARAEKAEKIAAAAKTFVDALDAEQGVGPALVSLRRALGVDP